MREKRYEKVLLKFGLYFILIIGLVLFISCAAKDYCGRPPLGSDKYLPIGNNCPLPINTYVDPPKKGLDHPDYNDPYWPYQWQLQKDFMNIEEAHKITLGDSSVIVWIIDTGVDTNLPDFQGVNFIIGHDYVHGNNDPQDDQFHGTSMASIICMQPNNGIGGVGVAPGVSIGIIKVLPLNSRGDLSLSKSSPVILSKAIVEATDFCIQHNRPGVINLSLGDYCGFKNEEILRSAILYARKNGILTICAAGNSAFLMDQVGWPAHYPESVSVGATTHSKFLAPYSNYQIGLDLCAPGGADTINEECGYTYGILCTRDNNFTMNYKNNSMKFFKVPSDKPPYFMITGTSAATPQVSGTVALILSVGISNPDTIMDIIYATAQRNNDYNSCFYGRGILDAGAAIKLAKQIKCGNTSIEQLKNMPKGQTLEETLPLKVKDQMQKKYKALQLTDGQLTNIIDSIRQMPIKESDQY